MNNKNFILDKMKFLQYIVMLWAYLPGLSYSEPRRNSKRMNIYDAPEPSEYVRTETDRSGIAKSGIKLLQ